MSILAFFVGIAAGYLLRNYIAKAAEAVAIWRNPPNL